MAAGGHSPPYDWIPAFAGITEEGQENLLPRVWG